MLREERGYPLSGNGEARGLYTSPITLRRVVRTASPLRSGQLLLAPGRWDRWRKVGLGREFTTRGEVVMREGPGNSGSQAQARGLGAGAIASLTGVGLLLIFMLQNTESVRLDFLFWGFTWPLWLLTLASALLGALVWFGLGVMRRHRLRKERRADRRG
jgi:uncharacterized integral membrane protein